MASRTSPLSRGRSPFELDGLPGHAIRRLQQIAVAIFLQETSDHGVTPVQYAVLQGVCNSPAIDQRSLARAVGLDTSTVAGVADRLETRGLIQRAVSSEDRRARLLTLTEEGLALLQALAPGVLRAQERMLDPLTRQERADFMRLIQRVIEVNNEFSRAPGEV